MTELVMLVFLTDVFLFNGVYCFHEDKQRSTFLFCSKLEYFFLGLCYAFVCFALEDTHIGQ